MVPDLFAVLIARAVPDLVHRLGLPWRQTVWIGRGAAVGGADRSFVGDRAVVAGARIVNDAVRNAIKAVARCCCTGGREVLFGGGDHTAGQILHSKLAPHLRCLEPCPINRRGTRQDAIELIGQLLPEQITLAATRRAAVPIIVQGPHSVIGVGK